MNSALAFVAVLGTDVQLFVKCAGTVDQSVALFLKDGDARALSEALLFPLGQGAVLLVDGSLLSGAHLLLLVNGRLERLNLPLKCLVRGDRGVNLGRKVSDLLVSGIDLGPDGLDLLGDLNAFFGFVGILVLEHLKFVLAAVDDAVLTLNLSLKVSSQNCNALLICLSSSLKVFDLSFQRGEVPLTELV